MEQKIAVLTQEFLNHADLEQCTSKSVREHLERELGADMSQHKEFIDDLIFEQLEHQPEPGEESDYRLALALQGEEQKATRKRATRASSGPAKRPAKEARPRSGGSTFNRPQVLSSALSAVCGGAERVVKALWAYVREHSLQDPSDRRFIVCDEALMQVFKTKRVHCFKMNRQLSNHLAKPEERPQNDDASSQASSSEDNEDLLVTPGVLRTIDRRFKPKMAYVDMQRTLLEYLKRAYGGNSTVYLNADDPLCDLVGQSGNVSVLDVMRAVSDLILGQ